MLELYDTLFWIGENNLSEKFSVSDSKLYEILKSRQSSINLTGVVISHFSSLFHYPKTGNDILADLLLKLKETKFESGDKPLDTNGCLIMEYEYFKNQQLFEKYLILRFKQGFRILRFLPKTHKYPIEECFLKKIYKILNFYGFPVIISLDEIDITGDKFIEWSKILNIANKFKNLPFIIDGGNSKELIFNSYLILLLKNSSNIYLNTHNLFAINQIEDLSGIAGSKRLIFDSYFPYYDIEISTERIINSSLSDKDKKNISNLNIKKLFKSIRIS